MRKQKYHLIFNYTQKNHIFDKIKYVKYQFITNSFLFIFFNLIQKNTFNIRNKCIFLLFVY